jgi:hypothetical protein
MSLVQISRRVFEIPRVPRDEAPFIELTLGDNQRVVSLDAFNVTRVSGVLAGRKTHDWRVVLWVESRA